MFENLTKVNRNEEVPYAPEELVLELDREKRSFARENDKKTSVKNGGLSISFNIWGSKCFWSFCSSNESS